ncbi:hypothetical protein X777_06089, partial [Ooceraea biroi]
HYRKGLLKTTVVGDIFSLSHPTVDVQIYFLQLVPRILIHDALRPFAKRFDSGIVPPLHHIAVLVKLTTLIVKAVGDLVTNHYSDAAVI